MDHHSALGRNRFSQFFTTIVTKIMKTINQYQYMHNFNIVIELPSLMSNTYYSTTSIHFIPSKFDNWYKMYGGGRT